METDLFCESDIDFVNQEVFPVIHEKIAVYHWPENLLLCLTNIFHDGFSTKTERNRKREANQSETLCIECVHKNSYPSIRRLLKMRHLE